MSRTARSILYGLTLGVLLALLLAPQSGWLVRFQARSLLRFAPLPGYGPGTDYMARERTVATAHPNDYQLQYAAATSVLWARDKNFLDHPYNTEALRAMEIRFPNSASLRANVMRFDAESGSTFNRPDEGDLLDPGASSNSGASHVSNTPMLRDFDQDAAAGERLDPDNAYFPFLRAAGLYAAHRDAAAQAAILRAGTKTRWAEYYDDEITGDTRLHELAFGDRSALWHLAVTTSQMFPHYILMRDATRIATYQAMLDEQTGHIQQGVALRHALMHCGGLMRARSQSVIGSLVGMEVAQTALQRPDGLPYISRSSLSSKDNDQGRLLNNYVTFLHQAGLDNEARFAHIEDAADRQAFALLFSPATIEFYYPSDQLSSLLWCWFICLAFLSNLFWLLLLGVLAWTLTRLPHFREAPHLPSWAIWWASLGTIIAVGVLLYFVLNIAASWDAISVIFTASVFLVMLAVPILFVMRAQRQPVQPRSLGRGVAVAVLTCAGLCGIYALAQWQTVGLQDYVGFMQLFLPGGNQEGTPNGLTSLHLLIPLIGLAIPILLLAILGAISRVRHVPLLAGLVFGYRSVCVPLSCVLLLTYGAVVLKTLHQERIFGDTLTRSLNSAGTYLAAREGQAWPGVVSEAKPGV